MKKITNTDIVNNVNNIITIGDIALLLFIIISIVFFGIGIYHVSETDEVIYFFIYSILYPVIYIILGLAIRIFLVWAAYLLKTVLDIKNNICKIKQ